jgi:hypothetical protein
VHFTAAALSIAFALSAEGSMPAGKDNPALARWRSLIPAIESVLSQQPEDSCPGDRMHVDPVDAADFDGTSFALMDFCPGGAYTDWIVAMQLDAGKPVTVQFRKHKRKIDLGFAQGASVLHGKDVKLVPEKHAIYDISYDNQAIEGTDQVQMARCAVDAYVWNVKSNSFDWSAQLTKEATRSVCNSLRQQNQ